MNMMFSGVILEYNFGCILWGYLMAAYPKYFEKIKCPFFIEKIIDSNLRYIRFYG